MNIEPLRGGTVTTDADATINQLRLTLARIERVLDYYGAECPTLSARLRVALNG